VFLALLIVAIPEHTYYVHINYIYPQDINETIPHFNINFSEYSE
jgi:hypothetical protein